MELFPLYGENGIASPGMKRMAGKDSQNDFFHGLTQRKDVFGIQGLQGI